MGRAAGSKAVIVFDEETTYGADPASVNGRKLFLVKENLRASRNLIADDTLRGNRNQVLPEGGNIDVSGGISVNIAETAHATLLKHLLGAVTTTGAADPYTHVLKVGSLPVGLVIEKGFTDLVQYFKYNGCRVAKASFKFPKEGFITADFDIKGAKETVSGTAYDSTVTELAYGGFSHAKMSIEEGGSAIATVVEAEITIDNDLDAEGYVIGGAGQRKDLPEGFAIVSGKLSAFFDSITLYNKAVNLTETSLKITLDKGVTPARSIEFFIPELVYERNAPVVEGPKGVMVELPFKAYYDNGADASALKITLKNGLATI